MIQNKKILPFLIIFSLLCSITTVFAVETSPTANAFIEIGNTTKDTVDVSLNILPQDDMNISSMVFNIGYTYSYSADEFQFSFDEENSDTVLQLDDRFSNATVSNSHVYYDTFNYVWESSSPVFVSANELITLATISLDISETAKEGEYSFSLECSEFYCYQNIDNGLEGTLIDAQVEVSQENYYFWLGEKMEANTSALSLVLSGSQDIIDIISINKNVDMSQSYITDTSIAEIVDVQNFDSDSGAFISIVGRKVGTTTLVVRGGYLNKEETYVTIKVVAPMPYLISVSKEPLKTTYAINESLDLIGLELRVTYDNNDVKYITYTPDNATEFTIDEYDFSTVGNKKIKVTYKNLSLYINASVQSPTNPDIPPSILRGDLNTDNLVTDADAIYLLYHTFFSSDYPLNQNGDFNTDNLITDADAIYLLYHTFFPNDYPL